MKVAVCAIAKNENLYIREWIEHYLNLGFSYINIFDNNELNNEPLKNILNYQNVYIDESYLGKHDQLYQCIGYNRFYRENYNKYDWILFVDIDEFLILEDLNNINDFIKSNNNFNNFDAIAINWKLYDDNDLIYYENKPVKERFIRPSLYTNQNIQIKSLIKCNYPKLYFNCHGAKNINYCDVLGNKIEDIQFPNGKNIIHEKCFINHYRFKTIEEFITNKYPNWTQNNIKNKWINFKEFFKINKLTNEKLNIIKQFGLTIDE